MKTWQDRLGAWIVRWRFAIVTVWLVAALTGAWLAQALPDRVVEASASVPGSASELVEQALRRDFDQPMAEPLVLALASERYTADQPPFKDWIRSAAARLRRLPEVRHVVAPVPDGRGDLLRSPDGRSAVLLIHLQTNDLASAQRAVPRIRTALAELTARIRADEPAARIALTGRAAATVDNYELNRSGGERAERIALPFTLMALLWCFGALAAAGLPLAVGLVATSVALGLGCLLASVMPISGLLVNVVKMLGLAVGIDYALLTASCWRALPAGRDPQAAVGSVISEAGATIAWSGLAVLVGLAGLLFTPLLETRSIGIAGMMVVCVAVLAALSLLPALLVILGPRLEWPRPLARLLARPGATQIWVRLAQVVTSHALAVLAVAFAVTACIALPGLRAHSGFDPGPGAFPATMESRIGEDIIGNLSRAQLTLPVQAVVRTRDGSPVLAQRAQLHGWVRRLERDPRIALVFPPMEMLEVGLADSALSRDGSAVLFQVLARGASDLETVQSLARDIARAPVGAALRADVGGPPVYYQDHVERIQAAFVPVVAFVAAASLLLLFAMFRSWLLPVKAVAANLLAVAAGYGAVVMVFQMGWLSSWIGMAQPLKAIPPVVPLLLFCLCFGLSMDYEVFLLRAVQRRWLRGADTATATAGAMVATAPVITGAAAIMAVVFSAYVTSDLALLKMLGLGLAVSVLVDATLIRCLLVPALVCVAGDWNWVPGAGAARRASAARQGAQT